METIKVVIVDDHPLMRQALRFALAAEPDMQVIGEATNGGEALAVIAAGQPDVVVLDLLMPQVDGLDILARLSAEQAASKILVISSLEDETTILQALRAGASGYLSKTAEREEIVAAIRAVQAGDMYLPGHITTKVLRALQHSAAGQAAPLPKRDALTKREQTVLELLGQGQSNQQIAVVLHITPATVRVHLAHILDKLGFAYRDQAVAYAARQQSPDPGR